MVALNSGRPEQHTLLDFIQAFTQFRETVVTRRTKFLLAKARDRAHVLVGLATAVANIDEVIKLIRTAPDPATAREQLMARNWPADDIAPLLALIDDPRSKILMGMSIGFLSIKPKPSSICDCNALPRLAATKSATNSRG